MKIVCYTEPTEKGLLLHYPSASVKAELLHLWNGAKEKYNGYLTVELKKPYKSRSNNQNRFFWGIAQQIASETGNDLEDIEEAVKERALKRGYPATHNKITGRLKPLSMTKIDTVEMGYLLDEIIQLASEEGIIIDPDIQRGIIELKEEKSNSDSSKDYDIF